MDIQLVQAGADDEAALENLLQLYSYDFSEFIGGDVDDRGRFSSMSFGEVWDGPRPHAFLVKVDGALAGFAIVAQRSHFTGDTDMTDMDEFFVMRGYRRKGVGRDVATKLFDLFPGHWEVREVAPNAPAQAFWRSVIDVYTGGRYEERLVENERWHGPVQSFDTKTRVAAGAAP